MSNDIGGDSFIKKILILAANPEGTSRLRLDDEVREIEAGLKRVQKREKFDLKVLGIPSQRCSTGDVRHRSPNCLIYSRVGNSLRYKVLFQSRMWVVLTT